jgi:uncharacterized protein YecE (DUF72 family)
VSAPIRVGSASWTDKTLVASGRFYPPECRTAEQRLRFYASQFDTVEVDSSYYGIPTPQNAQLWADRTPAGFVFNVKAFRLFTGHQTDPAVLHRDLRDALGADLPRKLYYADVPRDIRDELWRRFIDALAPLRQAGKLGAVHFQFAPWLLRNREGMAHVAHCVECLPGHLLAAEFRNKSWFDGDEATGRTLEFERALGLAHTVVDAPQGFANTVPCVWAVTNPKLALLRLHGRNQATWNRKGPAASDRFDYWYSRDELTAMAPEVRRLATRAELVQVIFNTNYQDQGQAGARLMREVLPFVIPAEAGIQSSPAPQAPHEGGRTGFPPPRE